MTLPYNMVFSNTGGDISTYKKNFYIAKTFREMQIRKLCGKDIFACLKHLFIDNQRSSIFQFKVNGIYLIKTNNIRLRACFHKNNNKVCYFMGKEIVLLVKDDADIRDFYKFAYTVIAFLSFNEFFNETRSCFFFFC